MVSLSCCSHGPASFFCLLVFFSFLTATLWLEWKSLPRGTQVTEKEKEKGGKEILHVFFSDDIHVIGLEFPFWLRLIQNLGYPCILHADKDEYVSNSIVMGRNSAPLVNEIRRKKLKNVGFFHFADEQGDSASIRDYHQLSYVFRNYFFKEIINTSNIVWIPNGPRSDSGITPIPSSSLTPAHQRNHLCNFLGSHRNALRSEAFEIWRTDGLCLLDVSTGFGGRQRHFDYMRVLMDSTFTLCIAGNSNETIRLYDAMEAGSIPVVQEGAQFLEYPLKGHPFVVLRHWKETKDTLLKISQEPGLVAQLQRRVVEFWSLLQQNVSASMKTVIDRSFQRSRS